MAQVIVRNLDDHVVESLKRIAKARGHSLEQELRNILIEAAKPTHADLLAEARRVRGMTPRPIEVDIEAIVREGRDSR